MNDKKRILIVADSMVLPRQDLNYEDTWVYMLQKQYHDVFHIIVNAVRNRTTNELNPTINKLAAFDCLEHFKPQLSIVQLGIVDCAPRKILCEKSNKNSFFCKFFSFWVNKINRQIKRSGKFSYVSIKDFKLNIQQYIDRCKNLATNVIFIAIPYPDNSLLKKSPKIYENVEKYNKILHDITKENNLTKLINPLDSRICPDIFLDGYHPNKYGHQLIFNEINHILKNSDILLNK